MDGFPGAGCGCEGYGMAPFTPYGNWSGCNPIVPPCNPRLQPQESVTSQLQNLISTLFGSVNIQFVPGGGGRAVWSGVCAAQTEVTGIPQNPGEGLLCYIIRALSIVNGAYATKYSFPAAYSVAQLQALQTVNSIPLGAIISTIGCTTPGAENRYQLQAGSLPSNPPYYFPPNDNSNAHWMLVA